MTAPEQQADWDRQWAHEPADLEAPAEEKRTPRWHAQERVVEETFGGFEGLEVIEIGAGRGTNGLLYGLNGARVTLLDRSETALAQAAELYAHHRVEFEPVIADLFELPSELVGRFDVSMSFGLCEHFLQERRLGVVRAHLDLLRPEGVAMLGVPNRYGVVYRLWIKTLMMRGSWPLGTEVPFSERELRRLASEAGGVPLAASYGSFTASVVNHGVNQVLFKAGRRGLRIPQVQLPGLDRLGYELLLPVVKPR
ncbi:MAG TPA: methyltransferase domain-containing protein [Gaiellaceae bacterium]